MTYKNVLILFVPYLFIFNVNSQSDESSFVDSRSECNLAKASQNSEGDMIILPFQNNTSFGIMPLKHTNNILN